MERRTLSALLVLLVLDLALFGDVLISRSPHIPCNYGSDAGRYFAPLRDFAYGEMRHGNVPLWNPYIFSGTPCLAAYQPALLYPLNLQYFVLPIDKAISIEIALHVYLLGVFMYFWARHWKLPHFAALYVAVVMMLSGPYYLHVFAGHLSLLSSWPWTALAFFAADALMDSRRVRYAFTGAAALTLALLAGHPQGVFEAGLILLLYVCLRLITQSNRLRVLPGFMLFFLAPALLAAVQLWPTIQLSDETIRSGGLSYNVAGSYSFPPENALTFLAPFFFGDELRTPYWGRWLFWEMSGYVGITTLALTGYATIASPGRARRIWLVLIVVTLVIAFGRYTPFFGLLWRYVPGFGMFRSPSKFLVFTAMFAAMLAGHGAAALLERANRVRPLVYATAIASGILVIGAVVVWRVYAIGAWTRVLDSTRPDWAEVRDAASALPYASALGSGVSLLVAASICAILAVLFAFSPGRRWCRGAVLLLGLAELGGFAWATRDTLDLSSMRNTRVDALLADWPGGHRFCDRRLSNNLVLSRVQNIWGYDPASLRRYIELIAKTQGVDSEKTLNEFGVRQPHALFAMLNCEYMVDTKATSDRAPRRLREPLPRFSFPPRYQIEADKDSRLNTLGSNAFDPRETVMLETEPEPKPSEVLARGAVQVKDESTDDMILDVTVDQNAILLMADAYASSWVIAPVNPGPQEHYTILPANHALRAIPLAAGHHLIRLTYAPESFAYGVWVSAISTVIFCAGWGVSLRTRRAA